MVIKNYKDFSIHQTWGVLKKGLWWDDQNHHMFFFYYGTTVDENWRNRSRSWSSWEQALDLSENRVLPRLMVQHPERFARQRVVGEKTPSVLGLWITIRYLMQMTLILNMTKFCSSLVQSVCPCNKNASSSKMKWETSIVSYMKSRWQFVGIACSFLSGFHGRSHMKKPIEVHCVNPMKSPWSHLPAMRKAAR